MIAKSQNAPVQLTLLSSILGEDFPRALERQRTLGLQFLDLKDGLWGISIEQLTTEESTHAVRLCDEYALKVHCFSTGIGHTALEHYSNETSFRSRHEPPLKNALHVAAILRPQVIRLLAPRLSAGTDETAIARLLREFPWVIGVYQEWIDCIASSGFDVLLENEARGCLLGSVDDVLGFFNALKRSENAKYTWDVQNLWQSGTFPTLEVYRQLRPLIGALHLKGGRADEAGNLAEAAALEDASWPVLEIVRAVVTDGVAPFICLNPSHGQKPSGYNDWETAQRDIKFLRREIRDIA